MNKYSPYEVIFLRRNLLPNEIFQKNIEPLYDVDDYVKESRIKMKLIHDETVQLIQKVKETNKKFYDKKLNPIKLQLGDLIKIVKEPYEKFKYIYDGPYEVKNIIGKRRNRTRKWQTIYYTQKPNNQILKQTK